MNKKSIIIIGCGKMAFSIAHYLYHNGYKILGFTDINKPGAHVSNFHKMYLGKDDVIEKYNPNNIDLVLALSDKHYIKKQKIFSYFKNRNYKFKTIIFPFVFYDNSISIGEGTIIFRNVNINSYSIIGDISVINSGSSIDHDCIIQNNAYISPSVTLAGSVKISQNVLVGTGANILPMIEIGNNSILGGGSLLTKNMPNNELWYGVPAKFIKKVE